MEDRKNFIVQVTLPDKQVYKEPVYAHTKWHAIELLFRKMSKYQNNRKMYKLYKPSKLGHLYDKYLVINNLWSLVNLLNDNQVLFYIRDESDNLIHYPIDNIVNANQPYLVKLIRQKRVYYCYKTIA